MPETSQRFAGSKIRAARHAAGMTQAALARVMNTRERNIIRWENDQHEPRFEHVVAIAKATGKPLEFFAADEQSPTEPESEPAEMARLASARDEYVSDEADLGYVLFQRAVRAVVRDEIRKVNQEAGK